MPRTSYPLPHYPLTEAGATAKPWRDRLFLAVALVLAGGMWLYSQDIMVPAERDHYIALSQVADVGDLYPRWYGTRELLLRHRDPYSLEVSREIQVAYYGHALDLNGIDHGRDEQRFAYPVYVAFFLAPTVKLSFVQAQTVVRWALAFLAALSVLLWLSALRWRPPLTITLALVALTLSSPPMVQALRLQQLAVLAACFLAACAAMVSRGRLIWAGCLLACATIKPQLALLPGLFFLIWITGHWKRRQGLLWGFSGGLGLLIGAGQALLPGWLAKFVAGLIAYRQYVVMSSLFDLYLTPRIAKPVAIAAIALLLVFCVRWRKGSAEPPSFLYRLALVLAVAVMALPLLPPFNQVLLLPGLLIVIYKWNDLWNRGRVVRAVCCVGVAIALLSCMLADGLAAIYVFSPATSLAGVWDWPFILSFGEPPGIAGLLIVLLRGSSAQLRALGPTGSAAG